MFLLNTASNFTLFQSKESARKLVEHGHKGTVLSRQEFEQRKAASASATRHHRNRTAWVLLSHESDSAKKPARDISGSAFTLWNLDCGCGWLFACASADAGSCRVSVSATLWLPNAVARQETYKMVWTQMQNTVHTLGRWVFSMPLIVGWLVRSWSAWAPWTTFWKDLDDQSLCYPVRQYLSQSINWATDCLVSLHYCRQCTHFCKLSHRSAQLVHLPSKIWSSFFFFLIQPII